MKIAHFQPQQAKCELCSKKNIMEKVREENKCHENTELKLLCLALMFTSGDASLRLQKVKVQLSRIIES